MKRLRTVLFWILALILTLTMAHYQRRTGPTWPVEGTATLGPTTVDYVLNRTHELKAGAGAANNQPVKITVPDDSVRGILYWKRYSVEEPYHEVPMVREGDVLAASLPAQPEAGKLAYRVVLIRGNEKAVLPPKGGDVITRYKGKVPLPVLIPHIFFMFFAMLLSTRAAIAALAKEKMKTLAWLALVVLAVGGFILGPLVQKFAFDAYWTGWPFGEDLTDNKTALAVLAWAVAVWKLRGPRGEKRGRWWAFAAAIILLGVYMIPHSMGGSSYDYTSGQVVTGAEHGLPAGTAQDSAATTPAQDAPE